MNNCTNNQEPAVQNLLQKGKGGEESMAAKKEGQKPGAEGTEKKSGMDRIRELIELGKAKESLTQKEILDALDELDLDAEQIEKIYAGLGGAQH